jgi:tetratricopeptide (TPR) repeat protein
LRIGEVLIRQKTRRYRKLRDAGEKGPAAEALKDLVEFELQEYQERAKNYPTDMSIKYELGRRQLALGKLDEAIGSLQQAKRDARHSVQASSLLGQAFEKKGWNREAAETLERVLESELIEDQAKDIRYHLGQVYEKMDELAKAQDQYSLVAQMDYNYKDVRPRLEAVRKKLDPKA